MSILTNISHDLRINEDHLRAELKKSQAYIKHQIIKKPSGDHRIIHIAPRVAKLVQYWLIENCLRDIPISKAAMAYRPGYSIVHNAKAHRFQNYLVRLDIRDFFPSIGKADFFAALREEESPSIAKTLGVSENDKDLEIALFIPKGVCGIGYPISPYICNIVMKEFDKQILNWISENEHRFGDTRYTRYADDLVISTSRKGFSSEIIYSVEEIMARIKWPTIQLNKSKTKLGSRPAGSAQVTGLRITPTGRITLHRKYKDHVRLLISLASKGKLDDSKRPSLAGHLNYCRHTDPEFYTKLRTKYFDTMKELIS